MKTEIFGKQYLIILLVLIACIRNWIYVSLEVLILFFRRDHQKNFLRASRRRVGRRNGPLLDYVPKTKKKKKIWSIKV